MNLKKNHILSAIFIVSMIVSCNTRGNNAVKGIVNSMYDTPVDLCLDEFECVKLDQSYKESSKYKMVVFVDSSECISCALDHLRFWNPLILEAKKKGKDINYIFIIAPKTKEKQTIVSEIKNSGLMGTIYLDSKCLFIRKNEFIPHEKRYHSFMLNKDNHIIYIGYPNAGDKSFDLYNRIVSHLN